ncbi:MAG: thioredoxin domain-containing protein [Rhodospirillales bacterium]
MSPISVIAPAENLLVHETSPYLRQHKDNPVHWRPWGEPALAEAVALDRPILLSIGYAACHWCHVMAHESFEDPQIASRMNEQFVSVKVDREERPDIDTLYQSALAMLGEPGGWPLTMFLTPAGEPFWGGTYFPPTARFGRPGFADVLDQVATVYHRQPDTIAKNVAALKDGLVKLGHPEPGPGLKPGTLDEIATMALRIVDPFAGGTSGAPKFPQPTFFRFLWRAARRTGSPLFADAVALTLDAVCQGGIYDHVGGGFARYATDAIWLVPHFEKMLYDNALLVDLLTEVWLATGRPLYAQRVAETIDWLLADMRVSGDAGEGDGAGDGQESPFAFASAFDADSEGEEGTYYVWTTAEIQALLGPDAAPFNAAYGVTPHGNWEGRSILHRRRDAPPDPPDLAAVLARGRAALLAARRLRVPPLRDDKVLADWNGLMIDALARAAVAFDRAEWLVAARAAFAFVGERMSRGDRLFHTWCAGRAAHPGLLEDYIHMARAALTLCEVSSEASYLAAAQEWVATLDRHHWDEVQGGYFVSADDTRDILMRTKSIADHAVPSGNGVAVEVLARLYLLTGDEEYRRRADRIATLFSGDNAQYLLGISGLLTAWEWLAGDVVQVVIVGRLDDPTVAALRRTALTAARPLLTVQTVADGGDLPTLHPAHGKTPVDGRSAVYVCIGARCGLPLLDPEELAQMLADE